MLLPLQARQLWTIVVRVSHRHPLPSLAQVLGSHALQGPHSWYRQLQVQQVRRVSCLCEDLTQATPLRVERTTINVNNYACVVGMTSGVAISSCTQNSGCGWQVNRSVAVIVADAGAHARGCTSTVTPD